MNGFETNEKWLENMVEYARSSMAAAKRNLDFWQEQSVRAIDVSMNATGRFQEEARKGLSAISLNTARAKDMYFDAIKVGLEDMGNGFAKKGKQTGKSDEK